MLLRIVAYIEKLGKADPGKGGSKGAAARSSKDELAAGGAKLEESKKRVQRPKEIQDEPIAKRAKA